MMSSSQEYSADARRPLPGLLDYLGIVWRRRVLFVAAFVALIIPCGILVARYVPMYEAAATILIENAALPGNVAPQLANTRIQLVSRRVQTTNSLVGIAQQNGMFPALLAEDSEASRARIAGAIRSNVAVETISAPGTTSALAFVLSYQNSDPLLAKQVADNLVELYLAENVRDIEKMVEQTSGILSTEVADYRDTVSRLEAQVARFRQENADLLPNNIQSYIRSVERIDSQLLDTERRIRTLRARHVDLQSALAQLSRQAIVFAQDGTRVLDPARLLVAKRAELAALSAKYSPSHPDIVKLRSEIRVLEGSIEGGVDTTEMEARLTTLRGELAETQGRYMEDHPLVAQLRSEIALLEQGISEAAQQGGPAPTSIPDNPQYIDLKTQLQGIEAEIQHTLETQETLQQSAAEYREKIAQGPEIENQLAAIERQYSEALALYQEFVGRGLDAQMAGRIEQQVGEFVVIEHPVVPTNPLPPSREVLLVIGLILSLGAAVGVAVVRDYLDESVRSAADLAILGVPALATIPVFDDGGWRRRAWSFHRSR